jgi:hypothetical protein
MESIWQYGGCMMSNGRLTQLTWLSIMILNTMIWYSVFTNGFFITLIWIMIISAIVGIIIKLKETRV